MTHPTSYDRPNTLADALESARRPGALALAGGALTLGTLDVEAEHIVDLQAIPELHGIDESGDTIAIGAAETLEAVVQSPLIAAGLKQALTRAISLNRRNGASVGESLISRDPPREWLAALVTWDVGIEHVTLDGEQTIDSIASLVEDGNLARLREGIIVRLIVPQAREREAFGSAFVARTPADEPIVNAAVFVRLADDGRVDDGFAAVGGASMAPVVSLGLDSLVGNPLDEANIASAVKLIAAQVSPVADYRGSAEYRREMARVCVQRALLDCLTQLR